MAIVGTAEITIVADTAGFEAEIASTDLGGLEAAGAAAGADTGKAIRTGVTDETGKLEGDLAEDGSLAGSSLRSGVNDGAKDLESDMGGLGSRSGSALEKGASAGGGGLKNMLGSLGVPSALLGGWGELGIAVVGVGAMALDLGNKMQSADTTIATSSGTSVKAATAIGNAMLDTAGKSEFSGIEQATAFASVAGQLKSTEGQALNTGQAMTVMNAAGDLATAKQISLGTATTTLAASMQAFKIPVTGAAAATDILFNASNSTGQSVTSVGATLDKLKGKLGDASPPMGALAALMVDMTNNGITGRAAVTGLNGSMNSLIGASTDTTTAGKASAAALASFGLSATQANGQLTPMSTIIDALGPKFATMSQSQQLATATTIFGASAAKQMTAVIDAAPGSYDKASASVNKMGSAHAAAALQSKTLGVAIKTIKAEAEDWLTMLGEKLMPVLSKVADWVGKELPGAIQIGSEAFHGLVTILTPVFDVLKAVFTFLEDHKPILIAVALLIGLMVAPFLTVIAVAVMFADKWKSIWAEVQSIVQTFVSFFTNLWGSVVSAFTTAWDTIKNAVMDAVNFIKDHWELLLAILTGPIGMAVLAIKTYWDTIVSNVTTAWNTVVSFLAGIWSTIIGAITTTWNTIIGFFTNTWSTISGAITMTWNTIVSFFTGIWSTISGGITTAWNTVVSFLAGIWTTISTAITTAWTAIEGVFAAVWTTISTAITTAWTAIEGVFAGVWTTISTAASTAWNAFVTMLAGIWTTVSTAITTTWNTIIGFFQGIPAKISGAIGSLVSIGAKIMSDIVSGVGNVATGIGNLFTGVGGWIKTAIGDLTKIGKDIIGDIVSGIGGAAGSIGSAIAKAVTGQHLNVFGLSIPYAAGGYVDSPTLALVGEAGPEVILPLSNPARMAEILGVPGQGAGSMPDGSAAGSTSRSGSNSGQQIAITVAAGAVVITVPPNTPATEATMTDAINTGFASLATELLAGTAPMRSS